MGATRSGFAGDRFAGERYTGERYAAESVRRCGLTFHALDDGRGGGTLAQLALPCGWRTGRARLERDDIAGGPYILAFSATGPCGEELIYRSEIRSPQTAASAELRGAPPAHDACEFLAESCDRVAAQFGIRLSGAAEFAGEHVGVAGALRGSSRAIRADGMRVYELNDGATAPLMLGVALAVEDAPGDDRGDWRAVDCYCLVTPHDRFEQVAATAFAAAAATLRIDPVAARLIGRGKPDAKIA